MRDTADTPHETATNVRKGSLNSPEPKSRNSIVDVLLRRFSWAGHVDEPNLVSGLPIPTASERKFEATWRTWAERLIKMTEKHLRREATLKQVPDEVTYLFDKLENMKGVIVDDSSRKLYYDEFVAKAAGLETITVQDVEFLIQSHQDANISHQDLQGIIRQKAVEMGILIPEREEKSNTLVDFELFASVLCEAQRLSKLKREGKSSMSNRRPQFKLPLDPDSFAKQIWDVLCLVLLLYCSFSVPYTIAFDAGRSQAGLGPLDISNLFIDVMFMIDISLTFVTSYDEQGLVVTDLTKISKKYLKTWFFPDLAGSFPFDAVITSALEMRGDRSDTLVALKFIRMLKLIRAMKFVSKLNKMKHQEGLEIFGSLISLSGALFLLLFSAHVLGCFFSLFVNADPEANWLRKYDPDLLDAPEWVRYITSLYWAIITLTTMGYGDITPQSNQERMFVIIVALVGAVIFSYTMGTVSSLISQVTGVDERFQIHLRSVLEYLQFREAPPELRRKVKNYYNHCWRRSAVPYEEQELLRDLSPPLRLLMLQQIGASTRAQLPLLQGFDDECLGFVVSRLRRINFAEGDVLYHRGEVATEMYIVVEGAVRVRVNNQAASVVGFLEPLAPCPSSESCTSTGKPTTTKDWIRGERDAKCGDVFGELALFPDIAGPLRRDTAVASVWGNAYILAVEDVAIISAHYPAVIHRLREVCTLRALEYRAIERAGGGGGCSKSTTQNTGRCRIRVWAQQIKAELIRNREAELLIPAAGEAGSDVFTVFRPAGLSTVEGSMVMESKWCKTNRVAGGFDSRLQELKSMSCVVSQKGELLYIDHSVEGLSEECPRTLGFIVPGRSSLRVLTNQELDEYDTGTWGQRKVFGCVMRIFQSPVFSSELKQHSPCDITSTASLQMPCFASKILSEEPAELSALSPDKGVSDVRLLTSSQEDFATLRRAIGEWLRPNSPRSPYGIDLDHVKSFSPPAETEEEGDEEHESDSRKGLNGMLLSDILMQHLRSKKPFGQPVQQRTTTQVSDLNSALLPSSKVENSTTSACDSQAPHVAWEDETVVQDFCVQQDSSNGNIHAAVHFKTSVECNTEPNLVALRAAEAEPASSVPVLVPCEMLEAAQKQLDAAQTEISRLRALLARKDVMGDVQTESLGGCIER